MAGDVEDLVLSISADTAQIRRALRRLEGDTARSTRTIERQFQAMSSRVDRTMVGLGRSVAGAFAGAVTLRGAQSLVDTATRIENALKVAGLSGKELTAVYDQLFASAQRNAAPLESLVTLYGRVAIVQNELKVSTQEMLGFTDNVAKALRVAGTDAQTASGALLQLSQAMGSGVVRAEEFNSILEGALPIAQAAAAGLDEAGGSVAKLRQLVVDGAVSSEAFFRAFEAGSVILDEKLAGAESTVSQAFVRLQNVLIDTAGELDDGTAASQNLVDVLDNLASAISSTDFSPLISGVLDFAGAVGQTIGQIEAMARALGDLTGASGFGEWFYGKRAEHNAQSRIEGAFAGTVAEKGDRVEPSGEPMTIDVNSGTKRKTVSLKDYAAPSGKKGGGGRGRGGGGGRSTRERADDYERLTQRIIESTAATNAETEAVRGLNPLVNDYGFAVEKARAEQELLTAAQNAGKEVTPALRTEISNLATQYAMASTEAAKLADAHKEIQRAAEDIAEFNRDLMQGIVEGFRDGKDAAEIFSDALKKISDRLLDMAFDSVFSGKGGGGIFGSIFGGLFGGGFKSTPGGFGKMLGVPGFATGTANTGGMRGQARGVVHGQEAVIPLPNGGKVPVAISLPKASQLGIGSGGRQGLDIKVGVDADNSGNLMPFVSSVADERSQVAVTKGQQQAQRSFPAMQADRQRRYS